MQTIEQRVEIAMLLTMMYENLLLLLSLLLSFTSLSASIATRPLDKVIAATATPPTDFFGEIPCSP